MALLGCPLFFIIIIIIIIIILVFSFQSDPFLIPWLHGSSWMCQWLHREQMHQWLHRVQRLQWLHRVHMLLWLRIVHRIQIICRVHRLQWLRRVYKNPGYSFVAQQVECLIRSHHGSFWEDCYSPSYSSSATFGPILSAVYRTSLMSTFPKDQQGTYIKMHKCWLDLCATASSTRLINFDNVLWILQSWKFLCDFLFPLDRDIIY